MQLFPLLNMVLMVGNPGKTVVALVCVPLLHFFTKLCRIRGFETRRTQLALIKREVK
jgi:hypothetical protein